MTTTETPQASPRLKKQYDEEVRAKLMQHFGIQNPMATPKLKKVVVNMGCKGAVELQRLEITRLNRDDELVQPPDQSTRRWKHLHPANYQVWGDYLRNDVRMPGPTPAATLAVSTKESYAGPIEVEAVVRLTEGSKGDIRFFAFRSAGRRGRTFVGGALHLPNRRDIDARLVGGSVVFGIGWGLAGFCPGPALVSFASGVDQAAVFVAAMLGGMLVYTAAERLR